MQNIFQDRDQLIYSKKCSTINSLIDLIELKTRFNFKFKLNFGQTSAHEFKKPQIKLPCKLVDEYFNNIDFLQDGFKLIYALNNLNKSYLFKINLNDFSGDCEKNNRNSYLVELVEDLDENENKLKIEKSYSETVSTNLLNESFEIIKKYDSYANGLINQIFDNFRKDFVNSDTENEIEINIPISSEIIPENSNSICQNYNLQKRRHSADVVYHAYKSDSMTSTLPNIAEDSLSDTDLLWRRHSLNSNLYSNSKFNRPFNNAMPTIVVDFEEDNDCKSSSRTSLDKVKLSDSESEMTNNQFKQYTKVTLKNMLNKSPTSNKNTKNETRRESYAIENLIRNSKFFNNLVDKIVQESLDEISDTVKYRNKFGNNFVDDLTNQAYDDLKKINQIQKINNLNFECDCVNSKSQSSNNSESLNCKLSVYSLIIILDEINFSNNVSFKCSNR